MRRIGVYIHEHPQWTDFTWSVDEVNKALIDVAHWQGRLIGRMEGLGFTLQSEALLQTLTLEVIKTSEIEGDVLDREQVRSSIARKLGMDIAGLVPSDRHTDGIVEMMLDATQHYRKSLTQERLFGWHSALFPSGRSGMHRIVVGKWRDNLPDDPMQVVSGAMGKEKVHFEAPASARVPKEMKRFLKWFNETSPEHPILKAAIAHLWLVTIHPFDDGNGRIARAVADMQLTRADGIPRRFYSMSAQIRVMRKSYYAVLERTQKGNSDITEWLMWFMSCLKRALNAADDTLSGVLFKSRFWDFLKGKTLNERQQKVVGLLLDGFDGKLTTSKWAKLTRCSQDTALRDVHDLMRQGVLEKEEGGGRSTGYRLTSVS